MLIRVISIIPVILPASQVGFVSYRVALGLVDIDDFAVTSALSVENVNVKPVPEPMTILGTGVALGFGFLFKKGRNRRK